MSLPIYIKGYAQDIDILALKYQIRKLKDENDEVISKIPVHMNKEIQILGYARL